MPSGLWWTRVLQVFWPSRSVDHLYVRAVVVLSPLFFSLSVWCGVAKEQEPRGYVAWVSMVFILAVVAAMAVGRRPHVHRGGREHHSDAANCEALAEGVAKRGTAAAHFTSACHHRHHLCSFVAPLCDVLLTLHVRYMMYHCPQAEPSFHTEYLASTPVDQLDISACLHTPELAVEALRRRSFLVLSRVHSNYTDALGRGATPHDAWNSVRTRTSVQGCVGSLENHHLPSHPPMHACFTNGETSFSPSMPAGSL